MLQKVPAETQELKDAEKQDGTCHCETVTLHQRLINTASSVSQGKKHAVCGKQLTSRLSSNAEMTDFSYTLKMLVNNKRVRGLLSRGNIRNESK